MRNQIFAGVVVLLMLFCLMMTAFASYTGVGLSGNPTYSMRQGSIGGLFVSGGGPGSGK